MAGESTKQRKGWTRRRFLETAGAAGVLVAAGSGFRTSGGGRAAAAMALPKPRAGARIRLLQWNSFVSVADAELKRQAKEFSDANGCTVEIETVSGDQLQPRTVAAVAAGNGPDIIQMQYAWPHLYSASTIVVTNEVNYLLERLGKVHPVNEALAKVRGEWRAIPYTHVPNAWHYRTDYFQKAGITSFPKTWDELIVAGEKVVKATGKPIAQTIGHAYGDSLTMWNPVLWGFGGQEVDKDGHTVVIKSEGTENALRWAIRAAQAGIKWFPEWLDPDNNQAYHADRISATLNGASIYIREVIEFHKFDKITGLAPIPSGPKGNFAMNLVLNHAIMRWSREQDTAKAFVLYLMDKVNYQKWMAAARGYDAGPFEGLYDDPVWKTDPKLTPFRDVVTFRGKPVGNWPGWPARPSKWTTQSQTQFVVADMFAKAVATGDSKAAMSDAEAKLKAIYGRP
jgi:ABC-type glycerol-3-phosphate transport system substrate-binding protein